MMITACYPSLKPKPCVSVTINRSHDILLSFTTVSYQRPSHVKARLLAQIGNFYDVILF